MTGKHSSQETPQISWGLLVLLAVLVTAGVVVIGSAL